MRILVTGVCGYVGSRLALRFRAALPDATVFGIDNLSRRGSETNLAPLAAADIDVRHGDMRQWSDVAVLDDADWVVDCAANPSVTAGVVGGSGCTPRQLMQHNLGGALNVLEYCRERSAGLVFLSTSRVYSIQALSELPLIERETRFEVDRDGARCVPGFSERGVAEDFSTEAPISLYGATKLASEVLALEYGVTFELPVWVNRCGVIGGPGQFGRADQGIFSFWVYSAALGRPLKYIGFGGAGKQVRDVVIAEDVADLVLEQLADPWREAPRVTNIGGGNAGAMSLRELTDACRELLEREITVTQTAETRPFDIPYYVTDSGSAAASWDWRPSKSARQIVEELCRWTLDNVEHVRGLLA